MAIEMTVYINLDKPKIWHIFKQILSKTVLTIAMNNTITVTKILFSVSGWNYYNDTNRKRA